jgi:hypothetical protein
MLKPAAAQQSCLLAHNARMLGRAVSIGKLDSDLGDQFGRLCLMGSVQVVGSCQAVLCLVALLAVKTSFQRVYRLISYPPLLCLRSLLKIVMRCQRLYLPFQQRTLRHSSCVILSLYTQHRSQFAEVFQCLRMLFP